MENSTARGLNAGGYEPFIAADATSSRRRSDHETGLQRLRDAAVPIVSVEMVVFEWLERADTPEIHDLLPLTKGVSGLN